MANEGISIYELGRVSSIIQFMSMVAVQRAGIDIFLWNGVTNQSSLGPGRGVTMS